MLKTFALSAAVVLGFSESLLAMEFSTTRWAGHDVILAEGPIIEGDLERLDRALDGATEIPHGSKVILLNSPGGDVREALRMSELLDSKPAHMVIPNGASCASACAAVLFIAGEYRTMEVGGRFGQHSCSAGGVPSEECNEVLARHAIINGVSHGSVKAFVAYTPPEDMVWLTREDIDCWGVTRYPFTGQSGFEKSEPCAIKAITQQDFPRAQAAWRVDFLEDGYRAFLRPVADHLRELQLSLFCDETQPGQLFLSMEIGGPSEVIGEVVQQAVMISNPIMAQSLPYTVSQVDAVYSRVDVAIPRNRTVDFLTKAEDLKLALSVAQPYDTIMAETILEGSREALLFAANNCIKG